MKIPNLAIIATILGNLACAEVAGAWIPGVAAQQRKEKREEQYRAADASRLERQRVRSEERARLAAESRVDDEQRKRREREGAWPQVAPYDARLKALEAEPLPSNELLAGQQLAQAEELIRSGFAHDDAWGREWDQRIRPWVAARNQLIKLSRARLKAEEERCQATPSCVADRMVPELCDAIGRRQEIKEEIAEERRAARRHGVVIISSDLASMVEEDRDLEVQVHNMRGEYQRLRRRPFNTRACQVAEAR